MGVNDAAEMLEAAQEECIRLERVIAAADVSMVATPAGFRDRFWARTRAILAQSYGDPLAEHDRAVKVAALEEAAKLIQLQRVLHGKHGDWWDGSDSAEQVVAARAAEIRTAGQ